MHEYLVSDITDGEDVGVNIHFCDNNDPSVLYVIKHTHSQRQLCNEGCCGDNIPDDGAFQLLKNGQPTPLVGH
ncbi:hypothetical protein [Marinobacterium lutimaris]|uniref:Uncharacterized protein n=1 Tax=Marinobacterium lutimaris TaxID=568106 RepID=A0A1H6DT60_9GAMM|nr:hypothetical protein [Marinobacterium lutimaris]SEG88428.1 hypothetical protein SAMN05444390_10980 [Marinobacterium lutimaris]